MNEFKKLGIENQVDIWWTCKRNISKDIGKTLISLHSKYYQYYDKAYPHFNVYGNVFNCSLEHYTIIKQAYLRGFKSILIMEDDIEFIDNREAIVKMFENLPKDYDLIKFWSYYMAVTDVKPYSGEDDMFYPFINGFDGAYSTVMYALSRKGMERYIELMDKKFSIADEPFIGFMNTKKYKSYVAKYYICMPRQNIQSSIKQITLGEEIQKRIFYDD